MKTILAEKGLDGDGELWRRRIEGVKRSDVERALSGAAGFYSLDKLAALVSPVAEDYLEEMARAAHQLSVQRFGRTVRLYAPLYLSNYCTNACRYCGFNRENKFERTRLSIAQALGEAEIIAGEGFRDILLVSSEDKEFVSIEYIVELAGGLRDKFCSVAMEVYQMETEEYAELFGAGIEGVTLYQETYNRQAYRYYHQGGSKSDYDNRLDTPERIAEAGMRQIGLGALLGLTDWRVEALGLAEHAHYLMKRYWQSQVSFSFPRLRPAYEVEGGQFEHLLSDKELVQMITALRLCFADVGMVLSTRERAGFRDNLINLGITKMSAGSKTSPGGYSRCSGGVEQFEVDDNRSAVEVAEVIKQAGFEAVWKDWDRAFVKD